MTDTQSRKVGLVLQGGGGNGAYEVGAVQVLAQAGIRWDFLAGTSVGAINVGHLAQYKKEDQGVAAETLVELWEGISNDRVYKKWYGGWLWLLPALWKTGIYTTQPLRELLESQYDPQLVKESGVEVSVSAVNLNTGTRREWREDDMSVSALMASCAFPLAFPPEIIDGHAFTDDGIRETTPLSRAIDAGCTEIYVVLTETLRVNGHMSPNPRIWDLGLRTLAVMTDEISNNDIQICQMYNRLLAAGAGPEGMRHIDLKIIKPQAPLGDPLDFGNTKALTNMEVGRGDAHEALKGWLSSAH